jgi:enediyne biosynthesis protein E4
VLALLGFSMAGYMMSLSFRNARPSPVPPPRRQPIEDSIAGIAGTDLVSTRLVTSRPQEQSPFRFAEIARQAGIDFVHFSGMTEERYAATANGSGVAIFDYDNDGKLDLYFATGALLPPGTARQGTNRLYKKPSQQPFSGRHPGFDLGICGVLPWHRRGRHRQRR